MENCFSAFIVISTLFLAAKTQWPAIPPGGGTVPIVGQSNVNVFGQCVSVNSQHCSKYGFNSTMFPTFLGHVNVQSADIMLGPVFEQVKFCSISRPKAEMMGCAILVPLCVGGRKIPPCQEDCKEVITKCGVNKIHGFQMAEMICSIFPNRTTATQCISRAGMR